MDWVRILAYITGTVDQELLRGQNIMSSTFPSVTGTGGVALQ